MKKNFKCVKNVTDVFQETPHNIRNKKQRIENKNFNLSETMYSTIHDF